MKKKLLVGLATILLVITSGCSKVPKEEQEKIDTMYEVVLREEDEDYSYQDLEGNEVTEGTMVYMDILIKNPDKVTKTKLYYLADYIRLNKYPETNEINITFYSKYDKENILQNILLRTNCRDGKYLYKGTSWMTLKEVTKEDI